MYLKTWSTDKQIWIYDMLVDNPNFPIWKRNSIKNVASIDNLYVHMRCGTEYDDFENVFNNKFEMPAAEPLNNAINGYRMSRSDWKALIRFVALQWIRTPAFYVNNRKRNQEILTDCLNDIANDLASGKILTKMAKPVNNTNMISSLPIKFTWSSTYESNAQRGLTLTVIDGKSTWLNEIEALLSDSSKYLTAIQERRWSIITFPDDILVPTSDHPTVVQENGIIVFPLSPHKVLYSCGKMRIDPRYKADSRMALEINKAIIMNAYRYIYAFSKDLSIPSLRPRIEDHASFIKVRQEYDRWYAEYRISEAPFIR